MRRKCAVLSILLLLLLGGFSSASATSTPAKIVTGVVSNVVSALVKWLWSLKSNTKHVSSRSMMKFENGYTVETVFDGSKHGIEPYSIGVSPGGELLVLDSENSNIYHISTPPSRYSRPKLIAGTLEGHSGHVDGKLREARLNHPKGITVDDRGNTYIADTMNMAIRKISDGGVVTTIAGGKWARGGGHIDGPSEDAKFSNDFDVVYIPSSCSLLVVDRGNQAIREIQLNDDDCNYESDGSFHLGISVLVAAGFFGYVMALLQFRLQALFSSNNACNTKFSDSRTYNDRVGPMAPYQQPPRSVRPPLIPDEDELEKPEEGFFGSMGRLVVNTASTAGDVVGGFFPGFKRKRHHYQFQQQYQHPLKHFNARPMQETLAIPDEYGPSSVGTRAPMPKRSYQFSARDTENKHHYKQSRGYYDHWDGDYHQNQQQQHHRQCASNPKTYYEKSCETNEIVFGAVQEQDGRPEAVVIKAVDYADPRYNQYNIRPRVNYVGYSNGY